MTRQITHKNAVGPGGQRYLQQIVSPTELKRQLHRDGESLQRPKDFGPDDEWNVGEPDSRIDVLVYTPDADAGELRTIDNTLAGLRAVINGGYLEAVALSRVLGFSQRMPLTICCDEDGMSKGLPPNRASLRGVFFVARTEGEDFASLTTSDVKRVRAWLDRRLG
jgi:hypothetical protein